MNRVRCLLSSAVRARPVLARARPPALLQKVEHHDEWPPQPFDNMPFNVSNRYVATVFFAFFFGVGFWSPFLILWYMMAKNTM